VERTEVGILLQGIFILSYSWTCRKVTVLSVKNKENCLCVLVAWNQNSTPVSRESVSTNGTNLSGETEKDLLLSGHYPKSLGTQLGPGSLGSNCCPTWSMAGAASSSPAVVRLHIYRPAEI